ncbi:hypothetical protein, partial [Nocardia gipuzkoensis]|uniref:hypothetical protein n=1 Tax=Nocardia gipuzkoensis TaxID=2749991 RepID=UPI002457B13B
MPIMLHAAGSNHFVVREQCWAGGPARRPGLTDEKTQKRTVGRRSVVMGSAAAVAGVGIGVAAAKTVFADAAASTAEGSVTVVDNRGKQRLLLAATKPPII